MNPTSCKDRQYYSGFIQPEDNVIFVFGSNSEGRHDAGATKTAREKFGAVYGQGEGLQGNSYALPTKDLRVKINNGFRSIPPEDIQSSIRKLYKVAQDNPDKSFCIAYTNTSKPSLNGYTAQEMAQMFINACGLNNIPENIVFSESWKPYFITPVTLLDEWWRHNGISDRQQASGLPVDENYLTTTDNWWDNLSHDEKDAVYNEFFEEL